MLVFGSALTNSSVGFYVSST